MHSLPMTDDFLIGWLAESESESELEPDPEASESSSTQEILAAAA